MKFKSDLMVKILLVSCLTGIFSVAYDFIQSQDKRSPEEKIMDQVNEIKKKVRIEDNPIYLGSKVVYMEKETVFLKSINRVFIVRPDGYVFSALTEYEFRRDDPVHVGTVYLRTGGNWESSFLVAIPRYKP